MYFNSRDPAPLIFCTRRLCSVTDNGIVKAEPIRRGRCSTEYDKPRVTEGLLDRSLRTDPGIDARATPRGI